MIRVEEKYNPFNDSTIHVTARTESAELIRREGFNDVIKHADIVNGHMVPKQLHQYPSGIRRWIRWGIWLYMAQFAAALVYSIVELF